jgi:hypothetical protein
MMQWLGDLARQADELAARSLEAKLVDGQGE